MVWACVELNPHRLVGEGRPFFTVLFSPIKILTSYLCFVHSVSFCAKHLILIEVQDKERICLNKVLINSSDCHYFCSGDF
jgi:hypothetical protein